MSPIGSSLLLAYGYLFEGDLAARELLEMLLNMNEMPMALTIIQIQSAIWCKAN